MTVGNAEHVIRARLRRAADRVGIRLSESMSRKRVQRFCDDDMRKIKVERRIVQ